MSSMFKIANEQYIRSIGKSNLHIVESLNDSVLISGLSLVIKTRRRWIWQMSTYTPTRYNIKDVLQDSTLNPAEFKWRTDTISDGYSDTTTYNVSGSIGLKLASIFGIDLKATDVITLTNNLGEVLKDSFDLPKITLALNGKQLNMKHPFVAELVAKPARRVLCLVLEFMYIPKAATLKTVVHLGIDDQGSASPSKAGSGQETSSVTKNHEKTLNLPAATCLTFSLAELRVDTTGCITVCAPSESSKGGFAGPSAVVGNGNSRPARSGSCFSAGSVDDRAAGGDVAEALQSIDQLNQSGDAAKVAKAFIDLLDSPDLLRRLLVPLASAHDSTNSLDVKSPVGGAGGDKDAGASADSGHAESVNCLLQLAGFQLQESCVTYPAGPRANFLRPLLIVCEALLDLEDTALTALRRLAEADTTNPKLGATVFNLISSAIEETQPSPECLAVLNSDGPAGEFLKVLGLTRTGDRFVTNGNQSPKQTSAFLTARLVLKCLFGANQSGTN